MIGVSRRPNRLAAQPPITVPTIVLHGACDGVSLPESSAGHTRFFTGPDQRRVVLVAGHFLPQEAPAAVIEALSELPKPCEGPATPCASRSSARPARERRRSPRRSQGSSRSPISNSTR